MDTETYKRARQEGLDEAIRRIESFKNKAILQMRIGRIISDEEQGFSSELIYAQIQLLSMKGS